MAGELLMGIDLGAGSLKASVIRADGTLLGEASHPIDTLTPRPGWAEQDPESWLRALCRAVPKALQAADCKTGDLAALGLSGGAHIAVLTDGAGQVIRPALLWSDQRAQAEAEALHARAGERIIELGFNKVNPTWTLAQLAWLKAKEPETVERVERLYVAKDYLRYRLTGDWHTDVSDAVGTLLADAARGDWSEEICNLIDWPLETLPPVVRPDHLVGRISSEAAKGTGLPEGLPVVAGSNDTTVEIFGAGTIAAGQGAIKLATAGVLFRVVDRPVVEPPVSCYPAVMPGAYYTATGTNSCASAHRWLRDQVFLADRGADGSAVFQEMDSMAGEVPAGSEGLLFHPYMLGERGPYWDPKLKAHFLGLTLRHDRRHLVRALYEGIAFSIRDLMEAAGTPPSAYKEIRLLGGGARSATWRQIMSDVLGLQVAQPANGDASFGAALVAGLGVGLYESPEAAAKLGGKVLSHCLPDDARHALYSELFTIYKDAQAALTPLDHKLHKLFVGEP